MSGTTVKKATMKKATTRLRELLVRGDVLVAPGAYDALTAMIYAKQGFEAVYMTGYGTAAALGMPDAGLATMEEMVRNARYIANAVSIPLISDADTGYGNVVNLVRTVREFIQAGVAGIHLEDQVTPKRCGHVAGKRVVPIDEAVGKIRAAVDTRDRYDPDFVIIARTDARGAVGGSFEEAVRRGNAYAEAGADLVFFEAPLSEDEVGRAVREIKAKIVIHCGGLTPYISLARMQELGIALTILPGLACEGAVARAVYDAGLLVKQHGIEGYRQVLESVKGHPMEDFNEFIGFGTVREIEGKYLPPEDTAKYEGSIGYAPTSAAPGRPRESA
jgi:2-methylisocitrate lyase-like PEP mutase family enzyme